MNVLIAGDSFAAEWPGTNGWVKLLARDYDVTNVAQAGVSEYKILQQIQTANLDEYDLIIVTEKFNESLYKLENILNYKFQNKDREVNKNPKSKKDYNFDSETIDLFKEYNQKDIELYNYVLNNY